MGGEGGKPPHMWGASCASLKGSGPGKDGGQGLCQLEPVPRLAPPPEMTAHTPAGPAALFGDSCLHPSVAGGTNGGGVKTRGPKPCLTSLQPVASHASWFGSE